ncbi:plasmid pRiA4b ORF-3 family protein [Phytoactinopolyspora sp. XMNu-373]|uniref:Plasmid pRiA4b ORF-3 family protein n=2 Tax=Phytoactinopolyspora mesophila TaxID=2650750 RepID=A0A7K3MA49_9ACTN|nr:plasmid pRiA4b ORF-3 family protein [Phytoactinopolyspora mesophila]NDL60179.1 plasmid pRiA4b ORF-3 family protein [Phytoactinopolyspora mesophila]
MQTVLEELLSRGGELNDPFHRDPPPSRRRPRRDDVVTYRVRVDVKGTKPPLWRRLELASDLFLDDVHDVIQFAFGWTDSHLHRFASGPTFHSPETEYYLCEFEVDEGEVGVPEGDVRLDEVLVEPGDKLLYNYDFGDDWEHVVKLEAIAPRDDDAPRALCTGGKRPGPAEDCGGVHGYELFVAANEASSPERERAIAELNRIYGDDIDFSWHAPTPFDIAQINDALAELGVDSAGESDVPGPLAEVVDAVRTTAGRRQLRTLLAQAALDEQVKVDPETAARMSRGYLWLMNRVGDDGIKLTESGYLPPSVVKAALSELELEDEWPGSGSREHQTAPVLYLRESAQAAGLVRKYRGKLLLSSRGRALRDDPVGLWWRLAEQTPSPKLKDPAEMHAGLFFLLVVAAGVAEDREEVVADLLGAVGWRNADGTLLTPFMASDAAFETKAMLRRVGGFARAPGSPFGRVTPEGVLFAQAALRTWP